ncbi:hypothetical protein BIW11_09041 [Tropilaelaps mercedesae]|uniref:Uncharacterized protein n=1 Tax=Tropilaelaps mercedesae TaxID=418985 RepID=A0A1V9XLW6_9ACAR|nr:hypothetical protein BIW11_09041 [Tropilaelaps mercedesae]
MNEFRRVGVVQTGRGKSRIVTEPPELAQLEAEEMNAEVFWVVGSNALTAAVAGPRFGFTRAAKNTQDEHSACHPTQRRLLGEYDRFFSDMTLSEIMGGAMVDVNAYTGKVDAAFNHTFGPGGSNNSARQISCVHHDTPTIPASVYIFIASASPYYYGYHCSC